MGMTNIGYTLHMQNPNWRFATLVAGNSGRPGGAVGQADGTVDKLHAGHRTQEEDIVANWLITTCIRHGAHIGSKSRGHLYASKIFETSIHGKWGMRTPEGDDCETVQGVDYTLATDNGAWYADAWSVPAVDLACKARDEKGLFFDSNRCYQSSLVFVAGPNAGVSNTRPTSTVRRTFNALAASDYNHFVEGLRCALYAGLRAAAHLGCDVVLIPFVSGGIYAGPWKDQLKAHFQEIVDGLLQATDLGHAPLGLYFQKVVWTLLE